MPRFIRSDIVVSPLGGIHKIPKTNADPDIVYIQVGSSKIKDRVEISARGFRHASVEEMVFFREEANYDIDVKDLGRSFDEGTRYRAGNTIRVKTGLRPGFSFGTYHYPNGDYKSGEELVIKRVTKRGNYIIKNRSIVLIDSLIDCLIMESTVVLKDKYYYVQDNGFFMIGKACSDGIRSGNEYRSEATYISVTNNKASPLFRKNKSWCYKSNGRTVRDATQSEIDWLDLCAEKGKYVSKEMFNNYKANKRKREGIQGGDIMVSLADNFYRKSGELFEALSVNGNQVFYQPIGKPNVRPKETARNHFRLATKDEVAYYKSGGRVPIADPAESVKANNFPSWGWCKDPSNKVYNHIIKTFNKGAYIAKGKLGIAWRQYTEDSSSVWGISGNSSFIEYSSGTLEKCLMDEKKSTNPFHFDDLEIKLPDSSIMPVFVDIPPLVIGKGTDKSIVSMGEGKTMVKDPIGGIWHQLPTYPTPLSNSGNFASGAANHGSKRITPRSLYDWTAAGDRATALGLVMSARVGDYKKGTTKDDEFTQQEAIIISGKKRRRNIVL